MAFNLSICRLPKEFIIWLLFSFFVASCFVLFLPPLCATFFDEVCLLLSGLNLLFICHQRHRSVPCHAEPCRFVAALIGSSIGSDEFLVFSFLELLFSISVIGVKLFIEMDGPLIGGIECLKHFKKSGSLEQKITKFLNKQQVCLLKLNHHLKLGVKD